MVCLPEFDTYKTLPKYAENPEDPHNVLALHLLKHRTTVAVHWRVLNSRFSAEDNVDELVKFAMGRYGESDAGPKTDMLKMNPTELLDFYCKAVEAVGYKVDPKAFTKNKTAEVTDAGTPPISNPE